MSNTLIFRTFHQQKLTRDAPSASAMEVEFHRVDLADQSYLETRMDEVAHVFAMGTDPASVAPAYVDIDNIGDADPDTGLRQIEIEVLTGTGVISIMLSGRRFGEPRD